MEVSREVLATIEAALRDGTATEGNRAAVPGTSSVVVSEREFQRAVIDLAHRHGWWVACFRPARTLKGWRTAVGADGVGWPDLVCVRAEPSGKGRVLFVELKSATGRLSAAQQTWIDCLRAAGAEIWVWRPEDMDEIERILR